MAEGASRERWSRTSSQMCLIANAFRDAKKRKKPFTPRDFNPWESGAQAEKMKVEVRSVKDMKPLLKQAFGLKSERKIRMVTKK